MAKAATKPGYPYEDTRLVTYLSKQIDAMAAYKSQREIAVEIGYDKPNMLSMIKTGQSRMPLEKVPALAKALNVDPAFLFRLTLEQIPGFEAVVATIFKTIPSANEAIILKNLRAMTGETDPTWGQVGELVLSDFEKQVVKTLREEKGDGYPAFTEATRDKVKDLVRS